MEKDRSLKAQVKQSIISSDMQSYSMSVSGILIFESIQN